VSPGTRRSSTDPRCALQPVVAGFSVRRLGLLHSPVLGLHTPASWQLIACPTGSCRSRIAKATWQTSWIVQGLPSSQLCPSATTVWTHWNVLGSQLSMVQVVLVVAGGRACRGINRAAVNARIDAGTPASRLETNRIEG